MASLEERAQAFYRGTALAPMVRASTTPLRTLALQYGADFVYTEELVDRSLFTTVRVENKALGTIDYVKDTSNLSNKTKRRLDRDGGVPIMLRIDPKLEAGKLVCQIGSGEPELALQAARHVQQDVTAIDINMGCPKKFSVSGGMGAALLKDRDRACRIIKTLRDNLPDKLVSCKIRLLDDDPRPTVDFCSTLIAAGVHAIAIHGRKAGQDATVPALWSLLEDVIKQVKAKFPHVPILLNGDFYTRQEWMDVMARTGANGVLLARPALYNTSLFQKPIEAISSYSSLSYDSPLLSDRTMVIQEYLRHCVRYDIHFKNAKYVVCEMMNSRRAPSERFPYLPQVFPGNQTIGLTCACRSLPEVCKLWHVKYTAPPTVAPGPQAPAGEHRYEDSYFLGPSSSSAPSVTDAAIIDDDKPVVDDEPTAKRARLEDSLVATATVAALAKAT